jgi:Nif-specific regulatory protein
MTAARSWEGRGVSIGRVEGNDLVLAVAHISSRHATIQHRGGEYVIADLDSTNGSLVLRGEQRLLLGARGQPELALEPDDLILLGDIDSPVRLRVRLEPLDAGVVATVQSTVVAARSLPEVRALSDRFSGEGAALQVLYRLVAAVGDVRERSAGGILGRVAEATLEAIASAVDVLIVQRSAKGAWCVLAEAHRGGGVCREPNVKICERVLASSAGAGEGVAPSGPSRGEAALLFGQHDEAALPGASLVSQGVGSGIAAVLAGERPLGVLQVNCAPGRFELGEAQLDLAVVLAHHATVALERADLLARLSDAEARLREENRLLRRRAQPEETPIAQSPAMRRALQELDRAAASDITVLLSGETGTGKEVAARYLHARSRRRDGLLVPVNCGALAESLLDSELFGHRKGAFTGASSDRKGVFEVAAGGTVFLDEIGDTPPALQVRLLRVLEEGKIKVVGDSVERDVDVRVVAATNRDLSELVRQGCFREDLYYRLRVFPVELPPLRDRTEDIEPLCRHFVARYAGQMGKRIGELDPTLVAALRGYPFPGNVRELANELERAVVRAEEGQPLTAELLSEEVQRAGGATSAVAPGTLADQLAHVEREIIERTLARHGGRKAAAAQELGLSRQGLVKKMERLGVDRGG